MGAALVVPGLRPAAAERGPAPAPGVAQHLRGHRHGTCACVHVCMYACMRCARDPWRRRPRSSCPGGRLDRPNPPNPTPSTQPNKNRVPRSSPAGWPTACTSGSRARRPSPRAPARSATAAATTSTTQSRAPPSSTTTAATASRPAVPPCMSTPRTAAWPRPSPCPRPAASGAGPAAASAATAHRRTGTRCCRTGGSGRGTGS